MMNCYYCGKNQADESLGIVVTLYSRAVDPSGRLRQKVEIKVPRCSSCYSDHNAHKEDAGVFGFLAAVVVAGLLAFVLAKAGLLATKHLIPLILLTFIVTWVVVHALITRATTPKDVKTEDDTYKFEPIRRLMAEGWTIT